MESATRLHVADFAKGEKYFLPLPPIYVTCCRVNFWCGTDLIGGGNPSLCNFHTSACETGTYPYYGEANRALMASLGVTVTNQNVYANFSWSSP